MESIGIIPARYGSTRFEGKVLKDLCGKPVIQHVYERAKKAKLLDELIVAADDDRIIQAVENSDEIRTALHHIGLEFHSLSHILKDQEPMALDALRETVKDPISNLRKDPHQEPWIAS